MSIRARGIIVNYFNSNRATYFFFLAMLFISLSYRLVSGAIAFISAIGHRSPHMGSIKTHFNRVLLKILEMFAQP